MRRPPPHSLLVLLRATAQLQSTLSSPLVVVSNSSLSTVELRTLDDLWNLQGERECVVIIKRPLNTIILPARVQLVTQFYIAEEGGWYYDYRFVLIILIHPRLALLLLLFDGGGWLFEYQELYNLLAISSKQAPCTCHGLITLQLYCLSSYHNYAGQDIRLVSAHSCGSGIYLLLFTDRQSSIKTEPIPHSSFLHSRPIQSTTKDRLETMNGCSDIGGAMWIYLVVDPTLGYIGEDDVGTCEKCDVM